MAGQCKTTDRPKGKTRRVNYSRLEGKTYKPSGIALGPVPESGRQPNYRARAAGYHRGNAADYPGHLAAVVFPYDFGFYVNRVDEIVQPSITRSTI